MEIRYPILLILIPILIILYLFLIKNKNKEIKTGSKIANTSYLKETDYYKSLIKKYKIIKLVLSIAFVIAILSSTILISRLSKTEENKQNEYKRDIVLCMDVSASVDKLNKELVNNLKQTVTSLKGERFGISIFNTTSVLIAPLTDDYEFITNSLNEIEKSIEANNSMDSNNFYDDEYFYIRNYIYSGTLEGNETRGSSLIGDGLASCIYKFPKLDEEERTRIIIFSTDNDLAGKPLVTLDKAALIAKKKNIKVYGIGTTLMQEKDKKEFESAVNTTGGKFYMQSSSSVEKIVDDIEETSKSLIKDKTEIKKQDIPTLPFILLLISSIIIILISKKVIRWVYFLLSQSG